MADPGKSPRCCTSSLVWCLSIICTVLGVAVIMAGIVVFLGYLTFKPKLLQISVTKARLDSVYFDQTSLLALQVTVVIKAKNDNIKARASFYNTSLALSFRGHRIAYLVAQPFVINPGRAAELNYVSQFTPIPLTTEEAQDVGLLVRRRVLSFELQGTTRARWKVGLIGWFKFWLHLNCPLQLPVDGTAIYPSCSSSGTKI